MGQFTRQPAFPASLVPRLVVVDDWAAFVVEYELDDATRLALEGEGGLSLAFEEGLQFGK